MRELLDRIEARQAAAREEIGRLREQITQLTGRLSAAERSLERLEITRETLLDLAEETDTGGPAPLPSAYRQILALFEQGEDGLHAKDVCQALGLGTEPRHTENTRAKLKRLVSRGMLTESEPGKWSVDGFVGGRSVSVRAVHPS
ncbi:hypothetical protein [Streptomyces sporangiiformans]|uniref:Uncharacterized protein n=1 Tax=Streptomyces sporangiiformans TaxID=2315329 RepID=A0A505DHF4_9ACTN|nr:hypothetical protein [Streptomyces sporangiiformans]TPQ21195.1 hypothetical protein FGD71_016190 [Streptomyces sporangiiformans]